MSKEKKLAELGLNIYKDHKLPSTRRDFITSGLIGISGMALVPSMMLSPSQVLAGPGCGADPTSGCGIPFLSFEGAGGMNIAGGNVMVGFDSKEDQKNFGVTNLADYIKLGLPPEMHPSNPGALNEDYGLVFHSSSGLMAGLNSVLTPILPTDPDLRNSIDGIIICARSGDDSGANPINAAFMANKAGSVGELVELIGSQNTDNGARSPAPSQLVELKNRSSIIRNFENGSGLLSLGGELMDTSFLNASDGLPGTARVKGLLDRIIKMSSGKLDKVAGEIKNLAALKSSMTGSKGLFDKYSPSALNPLNNENNELLGLQEIFGGVGTASIGNENIASIANLVLDRIAGVGSFTIGGCDYHNSTAASGQRKDFEIGSYIGMCIRLAALKGKDCFIHLYTDGGVVGASGGNVDGSADGAGRVIWVSDSSTRSSQVLLVYKHGHDRSTDGSLILADKTRQVGYFNKGGGINLSSTSVASNTDQIWKAVILNYLATMTNTGDDERVVSDAIEAFRNIFPSESIPADAESLIRFKSLKA